jgi:anti-sigma-K factor RskA
VVHEEAAAFVLDALDREEVAVFEEHLATCPDCEDELECLKIAAVALAFAVEPAAPPPELRARVLDVGASVIPFRRRRRPQLAIAAAVCAACAVAAVAVLRWHDGRSPDGLRRYTAQGAGATLLVDRAGEATLSVRRLPPAPDGKGYEIWVIVSGEASPAGMLRGSLARLTRPVPPGAAVAVSLEPAVGSPKPTGPLLVRAETT